MRRDFSVPREQGTPDQWAYGVNWDGPAVRNLANIQKAREPRKFAMQGWHDEEHSGIPGIGHPYWSNPLRLDPVEQMSMIQTLTIPADTSTEESLEVTLMHLPIALQEAEYILGLQNEIFQDSQGAWIAYKPIRRRQFEDLSMIPSDWTHVFHGTRFHRLTGILHTGVQPSERSHEIHGVWANKDPREAMEWGNAPLERSYGMVVHMSTPSTTLRSNRRLRGTHTNKVVIQTEPGADPLVAMRGIYIRGAGPLFHSWLTRFELAVMSTAHDWVAHQQSGHNFTPEALGRDLFHHVRRRSDFIGMDGWTCLEFGAGSLQVDTGISIMSIRICGIIQTLQTRNPNKKYLYLQKNPVEFLPMALQMWFHAEYPFYSQWVTRRQQTHFQPSVWPILGNMIAADRWDFDPRAIEKTV